MNRSKDKAESFVWSDCKFEDVAHVKERQQLGITLTDYRSKRWRFLFTDVEALVLAEPVYCTRSSHSTHRGKKRIALSDDDGEVLAFCYGSVQLHEEKV